eukprot:scaffold2191_cov138-Isochrysis_galbana.AAC.8
MPTLTASTLFYFKRGLGLSAECNSKGWRVFAAHGNASDVSAGCAVLVQLNSTKIKLALDANKKPRFTAALEGRFASLEVEIEGHKAWLTSIYLHAQHANRSENLSDLEQALGLIHKNSIIGGDFNCVFDKNLDTKNRDGVGSSTYNNPHSPRWEALAAHHGHGLTDIYRLRNGNLAGGYTRYCDSIATRI